MEPIYLDHNATTPLDPRVAAAMQDCWRLGPLNPSSQHALGRRAKALLEEAREGIAALLGARQSGARPDRLIFTSGGTEANNLAMFGLSAGGREGRVIVSRVEHPSVATPAEVLVRRGKEVAWIAAGRDGQIDIDRLRGELASGGAGVSLMLASNETGVLQPVAEAAAAARSVGAWSHTDAVQAVGKTAVDFARLGVDALSASAHKFHGPPGVGLLLLRGDVNLSPMIFGGFQQEGLRGGTEAVALAVGMHQALALWRSEATEREERLRSLRDLFETRLTESLPELVIHGRNALRLVHTSCIAFLGVDRQALLLALDQAGVACSTGSACASGSSEPSPVLAAMGCSAEEIRSSLRFSFGAGNTAVEATAAAARIINAVNRLRRAT